MGEPERHIDVLIRLLSDESPLLRSEAARLLRDAGEEAVVAVPALTKALNDLQPRVRFTARIALTAIGSSSGQ